MVKIILSIFMYLLLFFAFAIFITETIIKIFEYFQLKLKKGDKNEN